MTISLSSLTEQFRTNKNDQMEEINEKQTCFQDNERPSTSIDQDELKVPISLNIDEVFYLPRENPTDRGHFKEHISYAEQKKNIIQHGP